MTVDHARPADGGVLFSTERLTIGRCWTGAALDAYAELNADPVVMEHLRGPMTRQDSDAFASYGQGWLTRAGLGLLPVIRTADSAVLGMCGMHRHRWYPDDVEVGWRLARHAWGHGYATEAARGWLHRGFTELALPRVISITSPENLRSQAVMRRLGFALDHAATQQGRDGPVSVVVYSVGADRWLSRPAG
jgi:RimJ/RimL family protein N-acetyltransferase